MGLSLLPAPFSVYSSLRERCGPCQPPAERSPCSNLLCSIIFPPDTHVCLKASRRSRSGILSLPALCPQPIPSCTLHTFGKSFLGFLLFHRVSFFSGSGLLAKSDHLHSSALLSISRYICTNLCCMEMFSALRKQNYSTFSVRFGRRAEPLERELAKLGREKDMSKN